MSNGICIREIKNFLIIIFMKLLGKVEIKFDDDYLYWFIYWCFMIYVNVN